MEKKAVRSSPGTVTGAIIACLLLSRMARRITVAKLYHFDSYRDGMFRRMAAEDQQTNEEMV